MHFAQSQLSGAWLAEQRFTYADIALACALEYVDLRYPHDWRGNHGRLAQWHAAVAERSSLAETQPPK